LAKIEVFVGFVIEPFVHTVDHQSQSPVAGIMCACRLQLKFSLGLESYNFHLLNICLAHNIFLDLNEVMLFHVGDVMLICRSSRNTKIHCVLADGPV
jgi:hypothetical protein